ncbi:MAG: ABC transporter permease [Anaerolineales bacterium]|nr:ABC transporter permease [Anaerolineales bacterium]
MQDSMTVSTSRTGSIRRFVPAIVIGGIIVAIGIFYSIEPLATIGVLKGTIRQSIPLILGALCGLMGERSGVINIGIEGQMLMAAFIGFMVNVWTGNLVLAALAGVAAGALLGLLLGFFSITLKMDQIIGGTVINILAIGLTGFFFTVGLSTEGKISPLSFGPLSEIPFFGPVLFTHPPITYLTFIIVILVHYLLFYTRWGLRSRSVGEHPRAADTVGINVFRTRYINVILGGCLAGLAGAFLSLEAVGTFDRGMTNGRGFIALAVMIMGRWTPMGALAAALLFGFATAAQNQLQFFNINIQHQFVGMLPYVLTIVVLAVAGLWPGLLGRGRPPAAVGQPYTKE